MQRGRVCGSVCLFVPWTGTGSIADSNEMEATSGDRGRMETGSFVFGFFVVSSSFVFFCLSSGFFAYKERSSKL